MLNYITLQGRFTKDVEVKTASNGKAYTIFTLAVQRNYKNQQGKYESDFIDCIASESIANHIAKFFHKGSEIIVAGELQARNYQDQNGQTRKSVLVNVSKTYFTSGNKAESTPQAVASTDTTDESGDLPFEQ